MKEALMTDTVKTLKAFLDASPFVRACGMKITDLSDDKNVLTMEMAPKPDMMRLDNDDMFHGGPVAALIDTAGDFVVAAALGAPVPTINVRVDYFRPCQGTLRAVATARRMGRAVCVVDIDLFGGDGKLCAVGRGTYSGKAS